MFIASAILAIVIILRIVFYLEPDANKWTSLDFYPSYFAGELLYEGSNPYDTILLDNLKSQISSNSIPGDIATNPPFWLFVSQLYGLLDVSPYAASFVWFLFSLVFTATGLYFLYKAYLLKYAPKENKRLPDRMFWIVVAFLPIYGTLFIGQSSSVVFFFIAASIYFIEKSKYHHAAILLALAASIKIFPAFCLIIFLLQRKPKPFITGISFLGALQIPAIIQRPSIIIEAFQALFAFSQKFRGSNSAVVANQSIRGFLSRLSIENPWSVNFQIDSMNAIYLILVLLILVITIFVILKYLRRDEVILDGLLLLLLVSAISTPYLWHHSYVILLPIYLYTAMRNVKIGILCSVLVQLQFALDPIAKPIYIMYHIPLLSSLALTSTFIAGAYIIVSNRRMASLKVHPLDLPTTHGLL